VAESNLDGIARLLRPPDSQQANAEELLAELVRLVESSRLAPERSPPPVETVSLHPLVDAPPSKPRDTRVVGVVPTRAPESDNSYSNDPNGVDLAAGRRSGAWTFRAPALVLAGAAVIGSIFWLERIEPRLPKAPPFIAAAQGPSTVQPRSNLTVATSSDAGVTPLRDVTQPAEGEVVSSEERPIDLNARVSLKNPPPSQDLGPTVIGVAQPTAAPTGKPSAASVNLPAVAEPIVASPPTALQSLDTKAGSTVSLPPDPTEIATPTPSATDSGVAAHASDAPLPPVRPAPKAVIQAGGIAQRSTLKLELLTKLSTQSAAHVVVARAGATSLGASETPSEPLRRGATVNPEKGAKTLKAAQAPAEAPAAPSEQPVPSQQPNPNPVVHAFSNMVGVVTGLIPFATR
jgi:hypothetical protein